MGWEIGEGAKSLVRSTPQDGFESQITLSAPLNVSTVSEDIQDLGTVAPHLLNNGICKDGGITEMYETDITQANATVVYPVSNGKLLKLNISNAAYIYVNNGTEDIYVGYTSPMFFKRSAIAKNYLDVALSSDGVHGLGIYSTPAALVLEEFSLATQEVTNGPVTLTTSFPLNGVLAATIVRANTLTYASVQSTSGVIVCPSVSTYPYYSYVVGGTAYATTIGYETVKARTDTLSAYYNGGTVLFLASGYQIGSIYSSVSPWTTWTQLTATGLTANQIGSIAPVDYQPLDASQTTLTLVLCQASTTAQPTMRVTVSATGTIATASDAGNGYPVGISGITSAIACPWGSSGKWNSGSSYGSWAGTTSITTGSGSNANATMPELICAVSLAFVTPGARAVAIEAKSYKGLASILSAYDPIQSSPDTGIPINDFGGGSFDTDIAANLTQVSSSGTVSQPFTFWPPDRRNEQMSNGGGFVLYRTNNHKYVICQFTYRANYTFTEIGPGVVSVNACCAGNTIIDTNTYQGYSNLSGYVNAFVLPYNPATSPVGYFKRYNLYSSSLDPGLINIDTTALSSIVGTIVSNAYVYSPDGFSGWNSSGSYVSTLAAMQSGSSTLTYYNQQFSGTYVANIYFPPAADAIWAKGQAGIQMLFSSAAAQPNFFGYQLANAFPIRYQAFFLLKGSYYAFDGIQIWQVPLSNGPASAVAGPNYPLVAATGLTYLDASQNYAFFLAPFDNSVWAFDGGRSIQKLVALNQKPTIQYGVFNENEDRLSLITSSSVISVWEDGTLTENPLPFTGSFNTYSFAQGTMFVQGNVTKQRTYENLIPGTSVIIPLDFQSAYLGNGSDGQTITVNRVLVRVLYGSGTASALTITWHWLTPDAEGSNAYTVTPTLSAAGYGVFDLNPANNEVIGGSVEISTTDTTQKITILEIVMYYMASAEATASNHAS